MASNTKPSISEYLASYQANQAEAKPKPTISQYLADNYKYDAPQSPAPVKDTAQTKPQSPGLPQAQKSQSTISADPAEIWQQSLPMKDRNVLTDAAQDIRKGVLKVPGALTGLADIAAAPIAAPLGFDRPFDKLTNKIGEATGFQPGKVANETPASVYSAERQASDQKQQAISNQYDQGKMGLGEFALESIKNPRAAAGMVAESIPQIFAGGELSKLATSAFPALKGIAGYLGEGALGAGQQMENTDKSVDYGKAAGMSALTGLGTGLISAGSGKLSNRFGLSDIDQIVAGGNMPLSSQTSNLSPLAQRATNIGKGIITEGALEEVPQSLLEQGSQNIAEGKDVTQGMGQAAVSGLIAGGAMGGGLNAFTPTKPRRQVSPVTGEPLPEVSADSGALTRAVNQGGIDESVITAANSVADNLYNDGQDVSNNVSYETQPQQPQPQPQPQLGVSPNEETTKTNETGQRQQEGLLASQQQKEGLLNAQQQKEGLLNTQQTPEQQQEQVKQDAEIIQQAPKMDEASLLSTLNGQMDDEEISNPDRPFVSRIDRRVNRLRGLLDSAQQRKAQIEDEVSQGGQVTPELKKEYKEINNTIQDFTTTIDNQVDSLSGFSRDKAVRDETIKDVQKYIDKSGKQAFYLEGDIANLGGINKHFNDDHELADPVMKAMMDVYREEAQNIGAEVALFNRHGGDEFNAVLVGGTQELIDQAKANIAKRVQDYAIANGLTDITYTKQGKEHVKGTGVHLGTSIITPGMTIKEIAANAATQINSSKKNYEAQFNVTREPNESAGDRPSDTEATGRMDGKGVSKNGGTPKTSGENGNGANQKPSAQPAEEAGLTNALYPPGSLAKTDTLTARRDSRTESAEPSAMGAATDTSGGAIDRGTMGNAGQVLPTEGSLKPAGGAVNRATVKYFEGKGFTTDEINEIVSAKPSVKNITSWANGRFGRERTRGVDFEQSLAQAQASNKVEALIEPKVSAPSVQAAPTTHRQKADTYLRSKAGKPKQPLSTSQKAEANAMGDEAERLQGILNDAKGQAKVGMEVPNISRPWLKSTLEDQASVDAYKAEINQQIEDWNDWPSHPHLIDQINEGLDAAPVKSSTKAKEKANKPAVSSTVSDNNVSSGQKASETQDPLDDFFGDLGTFDEAPVAEEAKPPTTEKPSSASEKVDNPKHKAQAAEKDSIGKKIKSIKQLIIIALSRKDGNKAFHNVSKVNSDVAAKIKQVTGHDVTDWEHSIDEAAIRHILKEHGNNKSESNRGQIAVTKEDIANIDKIISSPDSVEKGENLPNGQETVVFRKQLGDNVIYVQEIRTGAKKLSAKTLWKVRAAPPATSEDGLVHTSKTFGTRPPQDNNSISQSAEKSIDDNVDQAQAAEVKPAQKTEKKVDDPNLTNQSEVTKDFSKDIPRDTAYHAYSGISFSPEKRADQTIKDYTDYMQKTHDEVMGKAKDDEHRQKIEDAFETYRKGYLEKKLAHLRAKAQVMSTMIAGPANFPVRRNEKANQREHNKLEELIDWDKKALKRLQSVVEDKPPVDNSLGGQLAEQKHKLKTLMDNQDKMKAANAAIRKNDDKKLIELGFSEEKIAELKDPKQFGGAGFPSFTLTNNNANIKRVQDRIADLEKRLSRAETATSESVTEDQGNAPFRMEQDAKDNRLRLFFDGKPDEATRSIIKSNGFLWSPKNQAWQRQLTANALSAADKVKKALTKPTDQGIALYSIAPEAENMLKSMHATATTSDGISFITGNPVTFNYSHNKNSATKIFGKPKKDSRFGRYFEPSGEYINQITKIPESIESHYDYGTVTFNNPLVISNDSLNWKEGLSDAFGGKRGKKLSLAVIEAGYDGIVTIDKSSNGETYASEIVNLTNFDEAKALYSMAEQRKSGNTVQSVHSWLTARQKALVESGRIKVVQSSPNKQGNEGVYHKGVITVFADNITSQDHLQQVLSHELFHWAELNDPKLKQIMGRFDQDLQARFNAASKGLGSVIENVAYRRVINSKTSKENQLTEFKAYMVTAYAKEPKTFTGAIKRIFDNFIAKIRALLIRHGADFKLIRSLSPADLFAMSKYGLNTSTQSQAARQVNPALFSKDSPDYKAQYDALEAQYFNKDGTEKLGAMLAPNGKRSNLNKVQWLQTRTQAFKDWFGDWQNDPANASKVIDANGEPRVMNHGTGSDFNEFDKSKIGDVFGDDKDGFFFTNNTSHQVLSYGNKKEVSNDMISAGAYAKNAAQIKGGNANIMPVFLAIKNPLIIDSANEINGFDGQDAVTWLESVLGKDRTIEEAKSKSHDGIIVIDRDVEFERNDDNEVLAVAFEENQIKSATGNTGAFSPESNDIRYSIADPTNEPDTPTTRRTNFKNWLETEGTKKRDKAIYELQNRFIDLKRQMEKVVKRGGTIEEYEDAYVGEEVYHQRSASRIQDFYDTDMNPLLAKLHKANISMDSFQQFLHARHAPSRNKVMAARNPSQEVIDDSLKSAQEELERLRNLSTTTPRELQKAMQEVTKWRKAQPFKGTEEERLSLSGLSDSDAQAIMDGFSRDELNVLNGLGSQIDKINKQTLDLMVYYGMETQDTIESLKNQWEHYVPLHRDEAHPEDNTFGHPIGKGFSVSGSGLRNATGSNAEVTNILAHIAQAREQMVKRGEKNFVTMRFANFVSNHPDPEFAELGKIPTYETLSDDGLTVTVPLSHKALKDSANIVMVRVKGKDVAITFNDKYPENVRLALSLKNMDGIDLDKLESIIGKGTRFLASVNTQFNPIFGMVNLTRDVQGALVNLASTPLRGKQSDVLAETAGAMKVVFGSERGWRNVSGEDKAMYRRFNQAGGTTGYAQMFDDISARDRSIRKEFDRNGYGSARKSLSYMKNLLSDFNTVMENGVRFAVFKVAINNGLSDDKAASLAKNITVNFNRKGAYSTKLGAYYAFFNASVQGTARLAETLASTKGKQIIAGATLLGAASALLGILGKGDDEWERIPEFIRERNLIIPVGEGWITIPLPLGLHIFPNIGRKAVEAMIGSPKVTPQRRFGELVTSVAGAFNPLGGNNGSLLQMITPTVFDPLVSLESNKDWTGMPIYMADFSRLNPTPGFTRTKDTASLPSNVIAEAINTATGGTEARPGYFSPTPDQIDYLFGQVFGGVGREGIKAMQVAESLATNEEIPTHKIPLAGRFYNQTTGNAAESRAYYDNILRLNGHEAEIELLRNKGKKQEIRAYLDNNPEAKKIVAAKSIEKIVNNLRKRRKLLTDNGIHGQRVTDINTAIAKNMKRLNDVVLAAQQ